MANARDVSFLTLRWPIYINNSVDNDKLSSNSLNSFRCYATIKVILCNIPASSCQETGNRKSGIYIRLTEGSTSNYILSPLF